MGGIELHPGDDRHVRDLRDPALRGLDHAGHRSRRSSRLATCSRASAASWPSTRCNCCAARRSAPSVGILPGAGADIAAWVAYAISKKLSKEPEKFGTGHRRGPRRGRRRQQRRARRRLDAGDRVRHSGRFDHRHRHRRALHEGHEPGADGVRQQPAEHLRGVHRLLPRQHCTAAARLPGDQGVAPDPAHAAPRADADHPDVLHGRHFRHQQQRLRHHRDAGLGVLAYLMEENGFPVAPTILGVVLGTMLEDNFLSSMIKADGDPLGFFSRPIAATLGVVTIALWLAPILIMFFRRTKSPSNGNHSS